MMEALRSFFPTPGEGAIGALDWPSDVRRKMANESVSWTCEVCMKRNDEILPFAEEIPEPAVQPSEAAPEAVEQLQSVPREELVPEPTAVPQEVPRPIPAPVEQPAKGAESTQKVILDFFIYSILFAVIAILIDIIRHPVS